MDNVSNRQGNLNNQKEILEIKRVAKIKNSLDRLNRPDTAE